MTTKEKELLLTEYSERLKKFITLNRISGRIKVCIDAHGEISYVTIPSASKRIVTQIHADFDDIRKQMLKEGGENTWQIELLFVKIVKLSLSFLKQIKHFLNKNSLMTQSVAPTVDVPKKQNKKNLTKEDINLL